MDDEKRNHAIVRMITSQRKLDIFFGQTETQGC